jgi:hypothetical protein
MRTVLWFLCLSNSLLSMMDIFCGVLNAGKRGSFADGSGMTD